MESFHSTPSNDERASDSELGDTIEVQRVREASEIFYSAEDEDAELLGQDQELHYASLPSLQPGSAAREEFGESEDGADSEPYRLSELSEPATVVTLHYADNDSTQLLKPAEFFNNSAKPRDNFRFTPAQISHTRSRSSPPAHLTDFQAFKNSVQFLHLETAYTTANELVYKDDKLDLDSSEGQTAGRKFLEAVEELVKTFAVPCKERKYREKFSQAYKVLYKEGLCYLGEILNSAQEGYSYIIVNSEKYIFSPNVLKAAGRVVDTFQMLKECIKDLYNM